MSHGAYEKRPDWLEFTERAPPMELHNLKLRDIQIKSPYPSMIQYVLKHFPDMRFQDCFVDGNDWSKGNDRFRDDQPVMQFVARQLQLMNQGVNRKAAFDQTRAEYLERRKAIENRQKIEMAMAQNERIVPAFGTREHPDPLYTKAAGVARQREAQLEVAHLNHIRRKLRMLRKEIEPHDKRRMNAKEVALDVEAERISLLPRSPSVKPSESLPSQSSSPVEYIADDDIEDNQYDQESSTSQQLSEEMYEEGPEVVNISRGKKSRPIDLTNEDIFPTKTGVGLIELGRQKTSAKVPEITDRPIVRFKSEVTSKTLTGARPDKSTFQAIMKKKREAEMERVTGKEPGQEDSLDFEDFMNLVSNSKNK